MPLAAYLDLQGFYVVFLIRNGAKSWYRLDGIRNAALSHTYISVCDYQKDFEEPVTLDHICNQTQPVHPSERQS